MDFGSLNGINLEHFKEGVYKIVLKNMIGSFKVLKRNRVMGFHKNDKIFENLKVNQENIKRLIVREKKIKVLNIKGEIIKVKEMNKIGFKVLEIILA